MTDNDKEKGQKGAGIEAGIEYRATIRFPRKDYEFLQKLIEEGEYTNITEIVRDAVKRFRLEWRDMESVREFRSTRKDWDMDMMPMMKRAMRLKKEMKKMKKEMEED